VEQFTSTQNLSLTSLKGVSKKHGLRVQSLLLAIYSGAIRRYLESAEKTLPDLLLLDLPQILAGRPKYFIGNHYTGFGVPVSLLKDKPILERIWDIETKIQEIYSTKMFLFYTEVLLRLASVIPYKIFKSFLDADDTARSTLSPLLFPDQFSYQTRISTPMYPIFGIANYGMGNEHTF